MGLVGEHFVDSGHEGTWRRRLVRFLALATVVVGGLVAGWFVFGNLATTPSDDGRNEVAEGGAGGAVAPSASAPAPTTSEPPVLLERGDRGAEVAEWQQLLQAAGVEVSVDSEFGPTTERLTARFQRLIGEEPTGRVTGRTLAAAERGSSLRSVRIFLVRDGELEDVRRRVDRTQLARGALEMLIAAPLQVEREEGLSSAVPATTEIVGVRVDGGTADVTLTGFATDPEPEALRRRVEQVVATLTRFGSIDQVRLLLPEDDAAVFSDVGVVLTGASGGDG
ncbi:MAG: GerMN domain-containing protein [Actinobacteria bacterium]|nr:GerMN domain-containing protein [Actinomycetota bacterium]